MGNTHNSDKKSGRISTVGDAYRTPKEQQLVKRMEHLSQKYEDSEVVRRFMDGVRANADLPGELSRRDLIDLAERVLNDQYVFEQEQARRKASEAYDKSFATGRLADKVASETADKEYNALNRHIDKDEQALNRLLRSARSLGSGEEFTSEEQAYFNTLRQYFIKHTTPGYPKLNSLEKQVLVEVKAELTRPGVSSVRAIEEAVRSVNPSLLGDIPLPAFGKEGVAPAAAPKDKGEGRY